MSRVKSFSADEVAQMLSAQTAVIALIVEELSDNKMLDRERFIKRLYNALDVQGDPFGNQRKSAPIRHLLSVLENDTIRKEFDWD